RRTRVCHGRVSIGQCRFSRGGSMRTLTLSERAVEWVRTSAGLGNLPGRWVALVMAAAATVFAAPAAAQGPGYDIRAELMFQAQASRYIVQIRNVGPTIPPLARGQYTLVI